MRMPKVWNMGRSSWPAEAVRIDRKSQWGNPYVVGKDGTREQVIALHAAWILTQPQLLAALPELRGKDLACWCAPYECHGQTLIAMANAQPARIFTLAVIGSRHFTDYAKAQRHLDRIVLRIAKVHGDDVDLRMVSGKARGADTLGKRYADANGIPIEEIPPDYKTYGDPAPFIRNKEIVAQADAVVAFWDRRSRGTLDALQFARQLSKPVHVVRIEASSKPT